MGQICRQRMLPSERMCGALLRAGWVALAASRGEVRHRAGKGGQDAQVYHEGPLLQAPSEVQRDGQLK